MGFPLHLRRRARALRARYLDHVNFVPTDFGHPGPEYRMGVSTYDFPKEENQKLHATAQYFAEEARKLEKLMDRNRWSRS